MTTFHKRSGKTIVGIRFAAVRGFTLVEVATSLAILGFLGVMAAPSMAEYVANARVRGVADQIRDGLATTRMEAIRRNTSVKFIPNATGWNIVLPGTGGNPDVTLATRPPRGDEGAIAAQPSATELTFNGGGRVVGGGTYLVQLTSTQDSCVATGGHVRCLNLSVSTSGNVRMCDPSLASPHPESCA